MPFLTHAGVRLRYERAGAGPAVLFVHGWAANHTYWEHQAHALRDRFSVITVDLRGHGESSRPKSGYGIASLAADLEGLVRTLRLARVAVVGWSMGGLVALELARRLGERLSALGLVGTTAGGLADPSNPHAQEQRARDMLAAIQRDFRAFVRTFAPDVFRAGKDSPLLAWAIGQREKTAPHAAAACFAGLVTADLRAQLGTIGAPTTVFHGRHDALLPLASGEQLAQGIRGAELAVFEQSGHAPPLEEPEAFNAAVARLLGRAAG
jgi:pimeloyl-ACP methyl ester carboxylesterase